MNETETKFIRELYLALAPKLMRYARIVLKDEYLAEEAVQDTFGDACRKVSALMLHPNPQAWMAVALRNTLRRLNAGRAHDAALLERLAASAPQTARSDESDPDLLYGDLSEDEDYKLLRRYAERGGTVEEFAAELGITTGACKMRLQRARRRLQEHFEGSDGK